MTQEMINHLHDKLRGICNEYLRIFCDKYELEYDPDCWIGGRVGELAQLPTDDVIDFRDMVTDLEESADRKEYFEWSAYDYQCRELHLTSVNYHSWLMGAPRIPQQTLDRLFQNREDFLEEIRRINEEQEQKQQ